MDPLNYTEVAAKAAEPRKCSVPGCAGTTMHTYCSVHQAAYSRARRAVGAWLKSGKCRKCGHQHRRPPITGLGEVEMGMVRRMARYREALAKEQADLPSRNLAMLRRLRIVLMGQPMQEADWKELETLLAAQ